ncbi:hypothetical protein EHS25_002656 [Saitozyma podzolica]|uniref:Uncharacterized protein n=1 Tax=Saitozyma podzolica TaxID=1890683 RepID=A0A427YDG6_9TREE|nr:hypothetical protein EHS25_002656 [Saitozyma podzolica]
MSFAYLASTPGLKYNYSLLAAPAGWVVGMAPLWWAIGAANTAAPGSYNNAMPKESWKNLDNKLSDTTLRARVKRAVAANDNTHTNLAWFSAALVAGNAAHVDSTSLHLCAAGWILSRVGYTFAYILIEDRRWSFLRSLFYWFGVSSCMTLFVKAANQWKKLPW